MVEVDAGNHTHARVEAGGGSCARRWGGRRSRARRSGGGVLVKWEGARHEQGRTTVPYARAGWGLRGGDPTGIRVGGRILLAE